MRVAGIMSGTSLDGIDVAIADIAGQRVRTIAHATTPYPAQVRERILAISNTICSTGQISRLNFELAELYARAVRAACKRREVPLESIQLVGCHGQTIYHEGQGSNRNTLQIGEAGVLAERLGVTVVSNFRSRDMAAGGQGAPLVPFVDYQLFRSKKIDRVALNIGGIANITILPKNARPEDVTAFDTGPGNMVIDQLVARFTEGRQNFDRGGAIAAQGHVDRELLDKLLKDRYFQTKPPKTAGREQYGQAFLKLHFPAGRKTEPKDLIATATAFTAATIALGIQRFAPATREVIAAGGGTHNRQLMAQLAAFLPEVRVANSAEFGIDPDAKEAIAFAILAYRTWRREPGNLPSATGARCPVVLGDISF
jgi:anhydro-N-acetylmuramic acid kinase